MEKGQQQDNGQVDLRRTYPVAPEKVWRAWTDAQALSQWFGSGKPDSVRQAAFDVSVGGSFRIAFTCEKGEFHEASGVYQEVVMNRRLVFSWAWKSTPERVSRITIELKPVAEGTELHFVHDHFSTVEARNSHEGGWTKMFEQLGALMQSDRQEA